MTKVLFLLVGAVFLPQFCDARSVGSEDSEWEVNDRESLVRYGVLEYKELLVKTVDNGRKWLQCVHEEIDKIARKNETIRQLDERLVAYLAKVRQLENIQDEEKKYEKMGEVYENMLDLFIEYGLCDDSNSDPEFKNVGDLLTRNDRDVFDKLYIVNFNQCADNIVCATEDYVDSLSDMEKRNDSELVNWLNDLKNEENWEKRTNIFENFFKMFND